MSDISTERVILSALVKDGEYATRVLPFLRPEYFSDQVERKIYENIAEFTGEYAERIDRSTLIVELKRQMATSSGELERALAVVEDIWSINPTSNMTWLMQATETWCRDRAIYNTIEKAIEIYQGNEKKLTVAAIPSMLTSAIAVTFDDRVGSDVFRDVGERFDYYANPISKIPFRIGAFNEVTCGGVTTKTLNFLLAGINCFCGSEKINVLLNRDTLEEFFRWKKKNESDLDDIDLPA